METSRETPTNILKMTLHYSIFCYFKLPKKQKLKQPMENKTILTKVHQVKEKKNNSMSVRFLVWIFILYLTSEVCPYDGQLLNYLVSPTIKFSVKDHTQ